MGSPRGPCAGLRALQVPSSHGPLFPTVKQQLAQAAKRLSLSAEQQGPGPAQLNNPGLLPFPQTQSPGNSPAQGTHPPAANGLLGRRRLGRRAPATDSARPPRQQAASGTRVCGCPAGSPALLADGRGRGGHCRSGLDVHLRKTTRYFFASGNWPNRTKSRDSHRTLYTPFTAALPARTKTWGGAPTDG